MAKIDDVESVTKKLEKHSINSSSVQFDSLQEIPMENGSNPNPNSHVEEIPKEIASNLNPNSHVEEITKESNSNPNSNWHVEEITKEPNSIPHPNSDDTEWPPCPTPFPNPNPPTTWAATLAAAPMPPGVTAQQEALGKARNIQRHAIKKTKKFLSILEDYNSGSDLELDFQPGSDKEETSVEFDFDSDEEEDEEGLDVEQFFVDIFEKDPMLREYYENNVEKGDFYCFVCQVRKDFKRKGMRYKSILALVQHARTVFKEGGRGAHRALARAVCRVVGWDPLCLPGSVKEDTEKEKEEDSQKIEESSENDEKIGIKSGANDNAVVLVDSPLEEKKDRSNST